MISHAAVDRLFLAKTRFRSDKNAANAKLENTSLSAGVFVTVFAQKQPFDGGWVSNQTETYIKKY